MQTSSPKPKPSSETLLSQSDRARLEAISAELKRRNGDVSASWAPHEPTGKQRDFLGLTCSEALYGGAAGGGKSDALLMAALQHVNTRGYAALLLRRTFADLALPGALMDRADAWLRGTSARWNSTERTWTFPSGATLTFGYLETEVHKYRYQSAEFQFVGFDELTQFSETQYLYLFSRLRRLTGSQVPIRMRAASNPGGVGHEWVKQRFVSAAPSGDRVFVPAKLSENPHVDQESYVQSLENLDEVTKAQLLDGNWDVTPAGAYFANFSRETHVVEMQPVPNWRTYRSVDFGYNYPACVWVQFSPAGQPFIVGEFVPAFGDRRGARMRTQEFADAILAKEAQWRLASPPVCTYGDPAGKGANPQTGESEVEVFNRSRLNFRSRVSSVRDGCIRMLEVIGDEHLPLMVSTDCTSVITSLVSVPPDSNRHELYDQSPSSPYQHVLDATRYFFVNRPRQGSGGGSVGTRTAGARQTTF